MYMTDTERTHDHAILYSKLYHTLRRSQVAGTLTIIA